MGFDPMRGVPFQINYGSWTYLHDPLPGDLSGKKQVKTLPQAKAYAEKLIRSKLGPDVEGFDLEAAIAELNALSLDDLGAFWRKNFAGVVVIISQEL